ncbi:MAG: translation initiation factor 2 [Pseudomonadota bacterium]
MAVYPALLPCPGLSLAAWGGGLQAAATGPLGDDSIKALIFIMLAGTLALTGCQTAKRGNTDEVKINVSPRGAKVTTSLGLSCTAPCTFTVKRRKRFTVTASKAGFRSQTVKVDRKLNKEAFRRTVASGVVPGGSALIAVDTISGSFYDHVPNPVRIRLKRR